MTLVKYCKNVLYGDIRRRFAKKSFEIWSDFLHQMYPKGEWCSETGILNILNITKNQILHLLYNVNSMASGKKRKVLLQNNPQY